MNAELPVVHAKNNCVLVERNFFYAFAFFDCALDAIYLKVDRLLKFFAFIVSECLSLKYCGSGR